MSICDKCERFLLEECAGGISNSSCGSFLENIYGIRKIERILLEDVEDIYKQAVKFGDKEKANKALVELQSKNNKHYLFLHWFLLHLSIKAQLENYRRLNVNLTIKDYTPESFFAGIPKPTEESLKLFNQFIDSCNGNS